MRRRGFAALAALALVAGLLWAPTIGSAASRSGRAAPVRYAEKTASLADVAAARVRPSGTSFDASIAEAKADIAKFRERFDTPSKDVGEEGGNSLYANQLPSAASLPVGGGASAGATFEGLNHFDSRYSGEGNAFSGEPADQGLCVSDEYAFEIVNSVVQVYDLDGTPQITGNPYFNDGPPVGLTLNEFYGVPPAFVRPAGPFGPFMFDVWCLYDAETERWFVTSSNLSQDPVTGAFDGPAYTNIAVSTSSDPLGGWHYYVLDNTNNGQNGTPDHMCSSGFCFPATSRTRSSRSTRRPPSGTAPAAAGCTSG
jgi:hypothetical protein